MPSVVIVGAQWGDEGKGKVTDVLAQDADLVVRYQGGNNAGHTIVVGSSTHKFHLIPSGMLYRDKVCVLGNGVVIDPDELIAELDALTAEGVDVSRLKISDQAHLILPTHNFLDQRSEDRRGASRIGTTGRGIGPAYRDKINRCGLRMADPGHRDSLGEKIQMHLDEHGPTLDGCPWNRARLQEYLLRTHARLAPHLTNASRLINAALDEHKRVLFEGAQGTLLDIDHGTYPFVTSSSPTAGGACIGAGIGPTRIDTVVGVSKAYATRVGAGPFPTEDSGELGERLRAAGHEYGTTTGRPRRCGFLDLVALRYAVGVNGMTHLALTKMDVLDELDTIGVATAYRVDGVLMTEYPTDTDAVIHAEPVFETLKGWTQSTREVRSFSQLPPAAQDYISFVERNLKINVALMSVGADRNATFVKNAIWES